MHLLYICNSITLMVFITLSWKAASFVTISRNSFHSAQLPPPSNFINSIEPKKYHSSSKALSIDIFGLGAPEVVIIIAVGALLFGPDRVKAGLRDKGVKGVVVSEGLDAERKERIQELERAARRTRARRGMKYLNEAIDGGNMDVLERYNEYENTQS